MAEESSSVRVGWVSRSCRVQLRGARAHGGRGGGGGLFELRDSDEDVQFDSESLFKHHVTKVSFTLD